MKREILQLSSVAAAAVLSIAPVRAEAEDSASQDFGEITVIARKQAESIFKVPAVESVLTADAIEQYQINDLQDITTKIPGLQSGNGLGTVGEQMSLRGVGSNSLDPGVDQSVTLSIDGLQITHGLAFRAAAFDLEQVEVLKGPQALYFGKNSTGGVIAFRSADPGDRFEMRGEAGYEFEARDKRAELIVSGPLTPEFGVRLAGMYSSSDGIYRNSATPQPGFGGRAPRYKRIGGGKSYLLRATLLWEPSPKFRARLKANFAKDEMRQGGMNQPTNCPDGIDPIPGFPWSFFAPDEDCKLDRRVHFVDLDPQAFPGIRNNGTPFLDLRQNFGSLELNYDISNELKLTSVTGYYDSKADSLINGTFSGFSGPAIYADSMFDRRDITQELRLDSDFDDMPVDFSIGGFFQDGKVSNGFLLGGNTTMGLPAVLIEGVSTIDIKSISMFGQLRWQIEEQVEIAGGARWQHEKRSLDVFNRLTNSAIALAPGSDHLSSKNWSPEFTITYTPTDDLTVFAALKQAYKSGSFNILIPGNPGEDKSYGDEKVQGGEVGVKSRLLDRSFVANIAGYYYRYTGLQTGVNSTATSGLPVLRTLNAGKAEVYGVDFDAHYKPAGIDGLSIDLAVNWNKTKFIDLNNVPCYGGQLISQGCDQLLNPNTGRFTSQDLTGIPFVRAPEWRVNFGFSYNVDFGDGLRAVLTNDNQYSSSFLAILGDSKDRPAIRQGKALKVGLGLTVYGPDDRWMVGLVGKNLTGKLRPGYCSTTNIAGGSIFASPIYGGTERNAGGEDEIGCAAAAGRSVALRVGFKI